jgi:ABC-type dipeptide/oligopeptide/nickel transport system permease component
MFMIALTVVILNLIVDVAYALLDPRIRLKGATAATAGA